MLLIEGPDIARDEVAALSTNIVKLHAAADNQATDEEYTKFLSAIETQKNTLDQEINNTAPGFCGIGPSLTRQMDKIKRFMWEVIIFF